MRWIDSRHRYSATRLRDVVAASSPYHADVKAALTRQYERHAGVVDVFGWLYSHSESRRTSPSVVRTEKQIDDTVCLVKHTVNDAAAYVIPLHVKPDAFDPRRPFVATSVGLDTFAGLTGLASCLNAEFADLFKGMEMDDGFVPATEFTLPVLKKGSHQSFRTWLDDNVKFTVAPVFYGEKSKRLMWSTFDFVEQGARATAIAYRICERHGAEWSEYASMVEGAEIDAFDFAAEVEALVKVKQPGFLLVAASPRTDELDTSFLAVTVMRRSWDGGLWWVELSMLRSLADEYRPLSLTLASDLAVVREVFFSGRHPLAMGVELLTTFDGVGEYKKKMNTVNEIPMQIQQPRTENGWAALRSVLTSVGVPFPVMRNE